MENKRWFKVKRFGYGWQPASWQGWVITIVYLLGIVNYAMVANRAHSGSDFLLAFAPNFIIVTAFFLVICYIKGEKPGWHWNGKPRR